MGDEIKYNRDGKVSVIIPIYNSSRYLKESIESAIGQTYRNIEILLVDDGSTDDSIKICEEMAEKDSRIRYFHKENQGSASARNLGLQYVHGDYVCFLDSDDWLDRDEISAMTESIVSYKTDCCICGFTSECEMKSERHDIKNENQVQSSDFCNTYFWNLYDKAVIFNIGTKLYKRSIIRDYNVCFDEKKIVYEDISFFMDYMKHAATVTMIDEPYYHYRMDNEMSVLHRYKNGFWRNTFDFCKALSGISSNDVASLRKAIVVCCFRAFLQEAGNKELTYAEFRSTLKDYCYPIYEKNIINKSDARTCGREIVFFNKLVCGKHSMMLWVITRILMTKRKKGIA